MAFRFSLETILRLRRSQEQVERLKLDAIISELRQTRARLDGVIEKSAELRHRFQKDLAGGLAGSEVQFQSMRQENTEAVLAALRARLIYLEQKRLAQLQVFYKFRQRREILENLRLRKLEVYKMEQARHEQQELDDLFLMRREIVRVESE